MRIALFAKDVGRGGASSATVRLAKALTLKEHIVDIFCLVAPNNTSNHTLIKEILIDPRISDLSSFGNKYSDQNRSSTSNTLFSLNLTGCSLKNLDLLWKYDIFNLHWTSRFLSVQSVEDLASYGKPVVFTLHDMQPFTGGCHYSAGCTLFEKNCFPCPQLSKDPNNLPRKVLTRKRNLTELENIYAVSPSLWIQKEATKSRVFRDNHIFQIDNSLDTDLFAPRNLESSRKLLGLSNDEFVIVAGAQDNNEKRKGQEHLIRISQRLAELGTKLRLVVFGENSKYPQKFGINALSVGTVSDDSKLVDLFSAADLLLLPSEQDNQPNIMLEALSCGVPVAAFEVGGIPDVVTHRQNGLLAQAFDDEHMSSEIINLCSNPHLLSEMKKNSRATALSRFKFEHQGDGYTRLFELLKTVRNTDTMTESHTSVQHVDVGELECGLVRDHKLTDDFLEIALLTYDFDSLHEQFETSKVEMKQISEVLNAEISLLLSSWSWALGKRATQSNPQYLLDLNELNSVRIIEKIALLNRIRNSIWWDLFAPARILKKFPKLLRNKIK